MSQKSVHLLTDFNAFHQASCGAVRAKHDQVHVFKFEEIGANASQLTPLFRTNFYQIGLLKKVKFTVSYYDDVHDLDHTNLVVLFKPGKAFRFKSDPDSKGYAIMFKHDFISIHPNNHNSILRFPILDPSKDCFFTLGSLEFEELLDVAAKMYYEYNKVIQESTLNLLELYAQILLTKINEASGNGGSRYSYTASFKEALSFKFKQLIAENLYSGKTIEEYAEMLFVTPKVLIEAVSAFNGATPKDLLNEAILKESKTLLRFTDASINDISKQLKFSSIGHFSNFFKKHAGTAPKDFRK